jgi:hypothetical protein
MDRMSIPAELFAFDPATSISIVANRLQKITAFDLIWKKIQRE